MNQRTLKEKLNAEQIEFLESLPNWTWDTRQSKWEVGYGTLLHYVNLKGDSLVSASYISSTGYKLGSWVARQRRIKSELDIEQFNKLSVLPKWSWNTKTDQTSELFQPGIKSKIGWYKTNTKIIHIPSSNYFNFEKNNYEEVYLLFNKAFVPFKLKSNLVRSISHKYSDHVHQVLGLTLNVISLKCYKCDSQNNFETSKLTQKVCHRCKSDFNFLSDFLE